MLEIEVSIKTLFFIADAASGSIVFDTKKEYCSYICYGIYGLPQF